MAVEQINIFGCALRDSTSQFGLNQNPSVYSITVARDAGQTFELEGLDRHGCREIVRFTLGAVDVYGIVQAWDEQEINIAGTGVFSVRLTDTRPALESVEVFLTAPINITFGENIISVPPQTADDINAGVKYTYIRQRVEAATIVYGPNSFRLNLSELPVTNRSVDGVNAPYRIRGTSMSLVSLIQQVADDHGFDWFVETAPNDEGVYIITVKVLTRGVSSLDMTGLADMHAGEVMRLVTGHEVRDEVTRTVVVGAPRATLTQESSLHFRPFWGFTEDGDVLSVPTYRIVNRSGTITRKTTTYQEMDKALNGEIDYLSEDELSALKSYAEEFWGRQFYADVNPEMIDANGDPWLEVASAGWWEGPANPDFLPKEGELRFQTDDGRWTAFCKLPDPGTVGGIWDDSVLYSQNVLATGLNNFYMKVSVERVELNRAENNFRVRTSLFHVTLPNSLVVRTNRGNMAVEDGGKTSKLPGGVTGTYINGVLITGNSIATGFQAGSIGGANNLDTNLFEIVNGTTVRTKFTTPSPSSGDQQTGDRTTRASRLGDVFLAVIDRRRTYGPWSSDDAIPENLRINGKARVQVDTSLAPWTFGYRGIINFLALQNLNLVGRARVKVYTSRLSEIDTGELEVAGLPAVNLGTEIGQGTNVTSIVASYAIQGIRTVYRCNLYTGELGRYVRAYQDLTDKLRREQLRHQNTLYPQQDYLALNQGLKTIKSGTPSNPNSRAGTSGAGDGATFVAKVLSRETDGPFYLCQIQKQVSDLLGRVQTEPAQVGGVATTNLSEHPDSPARIPVGTYVRIRQHVENGIASNKAFVMEEQPPTPGEMTASIVALLTNNGDGPRYSLVLVEGVTNMFTASEVDKLSSGVVNLAEPKTSHGHMLVGTKVSVKWVLDSTQAYIPFIEQSLNVFVPETN